MEHDKLRNPVMGQSDHRKKLAAYRLKDDISLFDMAGFPLTAQCNPPGPRNAQFSKAYYQPLWETRKYP